MGESMNVSEMANKNKVDFDPQGVEVRNVTLTFPSTAKNINKNII